MKKPTLKVLLAAAVLIPVAVYAQPRPGNPTTATVITKAEIDKIAHLKESSHKELGVGGGDHKHGGPPPSPGQ